MDENLESWLESTTEKRAELLAYALSPLPTEPGQRQLDVSRALQLGQEAGDLLADMDKHLIDESGKAVLSVRREHEEMTADEKKVLVKAEVSGIARLRDGMQVVYSTIKERRFVLMSVGRW